MLLIEIMSTFDTLQLTDIDLSKLKLIKETYLWLDDQDHSRWVFQTRDGNLYFKIWNPTYIRRDHIRRGMESGFYDETTVPALHALIFSKGICRGYVTRRCSPNRGKDSAFHACILEKTAQTQFFCVQYSRFHAMRCGDKLSLIDLEAIHPLDELPLMSSYYRCFFDDPEYEQFVIDLYCHAFPDRDVPQPTTQRYISSKLPKPIRKIRSLYQSLYRRLVIRLGTIFNHIERIECP
jgi:hypothetical protein